jgi:hypothetical protein
MSAYMCDCLVVCLAGEKEALQIRLKKGFLSKKSKQNAPILQISQFLFQ